MPRKSSCLDDPLRTHDMKALPLVYNRTRRHQKVTTLGRVSTTSRVLLRRKTAITSDADETCRLRSLSAEEKRIIEKIRSSGATGPTGSASQKGSADESYLELCRNVRLTFTGNLAVSCGNLAVNQARARRALQSARRPPAVVSTAVATTVKPQKRTPAIVPSRRTTSGLHSHGSSRPRSLSTEKGAVVKPQNKAADKELVHSQLKDTSSSIQQAMRQQLSYSQETSIVKELCHSSETPDQISGARTVSWPSCSPVASASALVSKQVEQRLSSLDLRGANPQTVDTMASLSSWVCTGCALLRQISAVRQGTPSPRGDLRPNQKVSQEPQDQEKSKLQGDDWDPAEVNVSRLIRRRHLEALLNIEGRPELLDQLLD